MRRTELILAAGITIRRTWDEDFLVPTCFTRQRRYF